VRSGRPSRWDLGPRRRGRTSARSRRVASDAGQSEGRPIRNKASQAGSDDDARIEHVWKQSRSGAASGVRPEPATGVHGRRAACKEQHRQHHRRARHPRPPESRQGGSGRARRGVGKLAEQALAPDHSCVGDAAKLCFRSHEQPLTCAEAPIPTTAPTGRGEVMQECPRTLGTTTALLPPPAPPLHHLFSSVLNTRQRLPVQR
jgi:hypothetical protein